MTNGDRIRKMDNLALAKLLEDGGMDCSTCPFSGSKKCYTEPQCVDAYIEWLNQEVSE